MTLESNVAVTNGPAVGRLSVPLRLNNVAELRLLFAACVVLSHAVQLSANHSFDVIRFVMNSEVAVQGFFILSGYLVFGSFDRIRNVKKFYSRRFLRIYPAYAVAVLLFITLGVIQALALGGGVRWADLPPYLLANLATLNFLYPVVDGVFAGNPMEYVNGALWSIKVELMFYASVPLLYALTRRVPIGIVAAMLIFAGIMWWPVLNLLAGYVGITPSLSFKYQLPGQLHFFGLGVALFARSKGHISTGALAVITMWAILLLLLLGAVREALHVVGLVVVIGSVSALPQVKDLFRGQDISYGIYLSHFPIIQLLLAAGAGQWPFFLYLGAVVSLATAYGFASWNFIERPSLAYRRAAPR